MKRALINAVLGDGHFWRHPEAVNSNIVWTSINKDWLVWKRENLLPSDFGNRLYLSRKAGVENCFVNSKALYELKTFVHPEITKIHNSYKANSIKQKVKSLMSMDLLDLAIWYLDDGCTVKRNDTNKSYRCHLCVSSFTKDIIFNKMSNLFNIDKKYLGVVKSNGIKGSINNMVWIIPKSVANLILNEARLIAPDSLRYKVPTWY